MTRRGSDTGEQGTVRFPPPRLTFACELDPARLMALFADSAVTDGLLALRDPVPAGIVLCPAGCAYLIDAKHRVVAGSGSLVSHRSTARPQTFR